MSLKLWIILILKSASYLGLHLEIDNEGRLKTKHYDKRDDFSFSIVNFPFISSNIPASPAYGIYISQLICYSRACAQYSDFLDRVQLLIQWLLKQGYVAPRLKSSLQKFYRRHHSLVDRYEISISQMKMEQILSPEHGGCLIRSRNCLAVTSTWGHPRVLVS